MNRVLILTGFELSQDPFEVLALDYIKRTQAVFKPVIKQVKPNKLLEASEGYWRIVLDEHGNEFSSREFASKVSNLIDQSRSLAFLIGPPDGHAPEVRAKANMLLSLTRMTLPHRMALCVLAEQIYRAGEIVRGGPYHRD